MSNHEQKGSFSKEQQPTKDIQQQNKGQPANQKDVDPYMANLGAGTGVDIGPGAAGEMGGAAGENDPLLTDEETERDLIYPDSGDFPLIDLDSEDIP